MTSNITTSKRTASAALAASNAEHQRIAGRITITTTGCERFAPPAYKHNGLVASTTNAVRALVLELITGDPAPAVGALVQTCGHEWCIAPAHQRTRGSFADEFYARIERDPATGCELWTGGCSAGAYELRFGSITDGAHVHHLCRGTKCCNPGHLMPFPAYEHRAVHGLEDTIIAGIASGDFQRELEALEPTPEWPEQNSVGALLASEVS